ncbi:MAG: CAP domain-containing protein, partial [Propionicimonas sp.]
MGAAHRPAARAASLISLVLMLSSLIGVSHAAPALASVGTIDTLNRDSVGAAYRDILAPATEVPSGWTGSTQTCTPGAVSSEAQQATYDAINFFRALGGLDPVVLDPALSSKAQEAALVMAANHSLSHSIPTDWLCRTEAAAQAAGSSNLALGSYGASAIGLYMDDPGASNTAVGHRRWVMLPSTRAMGSGSTSRSNALWVTGNGAADGDFQNPEWVSWPTRGYFPSQLEPSGRWSLTANTRNVNFAGASVTVIGPDGASLPLTKQAEVDGYGNDTLVWEFT